MTAKSQGKTDYSSKTLFIKAFAQAIAVIAVIYLCLAGWLYITKDKTMDRLENRLASQTILISESEATPASDTSEAQVMTPEQGPAETQTTAKPASGSETDPTQRSKPEQDNDIVDLTKVKSDGLYESSDLGPVPRIVRGKDTIFNRYKRPYDQSYLLERPSVALILVDYGLSETVSHEALTDLPPEISFSLSPYAEGLQTWVNKAHASGHETWMALPLEPASYPDEDPGPHTILVSAPEQTNYNRLNWLMSRSTGIIGFISYGKTAFATQPPDLRPVLGAIFTRGLGFIADDNMPATLVRSLAKGSKAPEETGALVIDKSPNADDIGQALSDLEERAQATGQAVGIFRPYPASIRKINQWVRSLDNKDINLAPASALAAY